MDYIQNILGILIAAVITNNIVLSQSWGVCPFLGVSKKSSTSVGMGLAVIFVMAISTLVTHFVFKFILMPLQAEYLSTIIFIVIIASLVQAIEILLKKFSPALYNALGVYLPLITTNCAVLKISMLNTAASTMPQDAFIALLNGAFYGAGFMVALMLMSFVREKIARSDVPASFKGFPIALIAAALIAMAFYGLNGIKFFA